MNLMIGISTSGNVFEGEHSYGAYLLWPRPVITLAKYVKSKTDELVPAGQFEPEHYCFREDSFDPVSRIRRGRFYQWAGITSTWQVLIPPNMMVDENMNANGLINMPLAGYCSHKPSGVSGGLPDIVVLGSKDAFTVWTIVGIESISTGEDLVTLKARQSLGALPDVYWGKVPADHRLKVQESIEKLADDYRKAGPESVIDRAREAATAILSAYLQSQGVEAAKGKDLGDLIKKLVEHAGQHEQRIVACAAEIAQRLHTRGKHAAKEQFDNLRPIREQDAELAVQCIGVMLCDLRWADWK